MSGAANGITLVGPEPHFGLASGAEGEPHVARVVVRSEEVAAILDGLRLHDVDTTIALLRLVMGHLGGEISTDLSAEDGWAERPECASDLEVLTARLPLAARLHRFLVTRREDAFGGSMAVWEGRQAEIREMFVGELPGFAISGKERDVLVREVRAELKRLDRDDDEYKCERRELRAILADTGRKKGTGRACTLSTLSMPTLVEWLRRLGPDITVRGFYDLPPKRQKKLRRRHETIRDMWIRIRREIERGPKERVGR